MDVPIGPITNAIRLCHIYIDMITCGRAHTNTELNILTICFLFAFQLHMCVRVCASVHAQYFFRIRSILSQSFTLSCFLFFCSIFITPTLFSTRARHLEHSTSKPFASVIFATPISSTVLINFHNAIQLRPSVFFPICRRYFEIFI